MKIAYADPPYLGCGQSHYSKHHENAGRFDHPQVHIELMGHMDTVYDAWALSLHEPSLRVLLPAAPEGVRVAAWVKPFASFKPGVDPAYTWEPVIYRTARVWSRDQNTVPDHHAANITMQRGLPGAKPLSFCWWLFDLIGAQPTDSFADLFPGTGAVREAWASWCDRGRTDQLPIFDGDAA